MDILTAIKQRDDAMDDVAILLNHIDLIEEELRERAIIDHMRWQNGSTHKGSFEDCQKESCVRVKKMLEEKRQR